MSILALPLAQVIPLLGLPSEITVVSRAVNVDADGFPTTTESGIQRQAVVHPISGRDMARETGGQRTSAGLQLFVREPLVVGDQLDYQQPTAAASARWVVVHAEDWISVGGFCRAFAVSA